MTLSVRSSASPAAVSVVLGAILGVVAVLSLRLGYTALDWSDLVQALCHPSSPAGIIVTEIRLPRITLAALVGAALGGGGAALQGLFHNPLAEPGLTGVSSCAALGAVAALYFGAGAVWPWAVPVAGLLGAALATSAHLVLVVRGAGPLTLILAGIALSSWATALISLALNLAPHPYALGELVLWLLGSVRDRSGEDVMVCLPFVVAGVALLLACRRDLDALALGDETAASLGVPLARLRLQVILGSALAVGACVAVAGAIGFVGLIVPHLLRPVVGARPGRLLLPSALGGAVLLVVADAVVRLISVGPELQVGVVTALVGAPFFLILILKTARGGA
ncbi:FecCD family ABC transporter permease [Pararhodospirillum photometricum]|uniref:Hemin transport system permease protein, HmuU2 n=1 Tax=Pararhodospirillum photometricum DSM 122 TaxID=1150469 RepID=H6SPH1_PARPM|nr:iron ABC transporter permease [Pararhodospirillum photometricum]CCG09496.1 Hemin transport system permease protein, HmuU2 [Pararhodospirillum photometricum DSM 122]